MSPRQRGEGGKDQRAVKKISCAAHMNSCDFQGILCSNGSHGETDNNFLASVFGQDFNVFWLCLVDCAGSQTQVR